MALVDALGNLVRFLLLPGQSHQSKGLAPLISNLPFGALLADKAFDSDSLLRELQVRGATAVIPPKANRKKRRSYDKGAYKSRHLIENFFPKIKEYRDIATRYDKTDSSYAANWSLVAALLHHAKTFCPQALALHLCKLLPSASPSDAYPSPRIE